MASRASFSLSFGAVTVTACALVWIACGGSSTTSVGDTDAGGVGSNGSSSGTGSSGSGSGGGVSSSSGASSGGGAGASSSGGSGGSSSGSGGSGSGSGSGGSGGATDAGTCPGVPCPSGQTCCASVSLGAPTCQTSCTPADVVGCTGPADCVGLADAGECCATAVLENNPDGAAFPSCAVLSLTSQCGVCSSDITFGCQAPGSTVATDKLHVCTQTSDCATDSNNNSCCAVDGYNICINVGVATIAKLKCLN